MRHRSRHAARLMLGCAGALAVLAALDAGAHRQARQPVRAPTAARIGCLAPDFELADRAGRQWRLRDLRGRPTTLVFACGCSDCRRLLDDHSRRRARGVLVISSSLSPALERPAPGGGARFPVLFDAFSATVTAYSSLQCPTVWVIDPDGLISYRSRPGEQSPGEIVASVLQRCGE
jgi:peroxiredoxin